MKLYKVNYMDDCDNYSYLTVGSSKEEVEEREVKRLSLECSCFMNCWVHEISEVDGHEIIVN